MGKKNLSSFERRRDTVKRKASELSKLCNVKVAVIVYGPNGEFTSWPENPSDVIDSFQRASAQHRHRGRRPKEKLDLSDFLDSEIKSLQKQLSDQNETDDSLFLSDEQVDFLPKESLLALSDSLESKIQGIDSRIEFLNSQGNDEDVEFSDFIQSLLNQPDQAVNEGGELCLDNKPWCGF